MQYVTDNRTAIPSKFENAVLEKNGEDHLDDRVKMEGY
jgi:hypothetical protein